MIVISSATQGNWSLTFPAKKNYVIAGRALQSRAEITAVIFASYIKFILNLVLDKGLKKVININLSLSWEREKQVAMQQLKDV